MELPDQRILGSAVYDFGEDSHGDHACASLGDWFGKFICDDCSGYKPSFKRGTIEPGLRRARAQKAA